MKSFSILLGALLSIMFLIGCQQSTGADTTTIAVDNPESPYPREEAIGNGDVVDIFGEITNLDKFEEFIENFEAGIEDEIRITLYTVEGDPVFYNLNFDGNKINYTYDDSQDGYAGADKGAQSTSCSEITSENTDQGTMYSLKECASSDVGSTFYFLIPET
ncbi:DUF4362 domain-containing protein [Planomicrobium sp. Y74]|uniref:DUF4362 domain-containing protein n=1 Tax=Planomicrobium sp. Y74 TaxID=2478977 RepID=UPI00257128F0|nr:DUF4362 domain-containing protein [Planomicrobium sp. Y74]